MAEIDWAGVRTRHSLASVARRTGFDVPGGGSVMVCCPLPGHDDSTPSMELRLDDDLYWCYGCEAHGDVVQWVRDVEGVKAGDAVAILDSERPITGVLTAGAVRLSSSRPVVERDKPDLERSGVSRVKAANEGAWGYYTFETLHMRGVDYLTGRNIDVSALEAELHRPVVGHTPHKIDGLVTRLHAKGFTDDELVDAGLATRNSDGSVIDFFRGRVVLPVTDDSGQVIGLIGRSVEDRFPKYLNQARTATYDKSVALYRPSTSKLDPDANVVVVEGTLDALAIAAQSAKSGVLAKFAPVTSSGLALSDVQMDRILGIHGRAPVFAGDGDKPGREAALDWAAKAALQGRESVVVDWPDGEDPASWLAAHGENGLHAVTRKGCIESPPRDVRPRHCGAILTGAALDGLPDEGDGSAALARIVDDVANAGHRLGSKAGERYAAAAAEVLAPVVVNIEIEAATNGCEVTNLVSQIAVYGAKLPTAGQMPFVTGAALAIEARDLGAAGWVERQLHAALDSATGAGNVDDGVDVDSAPTSVASSSVGLTV
jgi:DNA primase